MRKCLVSILCAATLPACAFGAGFTTHQEITRRAIPLIDGRAYADLRSVLDFAPDAGASGSAHPDAYYALAYLYTRQAAHYRRVAATVHGYDGNLFNKTAAAYLRATDMGDPHQARTAAFFLGNAAHQAADNAWHPGFNAAAEQRDNASEGQIELGVDIFCMWEQGQRSRRVAWFVPARAVSDVLAGCGLAVSPDEIERGMGLMRLARFVEQVSGIRLYLQMRETLPWAHANYLSYANGGVLDGAAFAATDMEAFWDQVRYGKTAATRFPATVAATQLPTPGAEDAALRLAVELSLLGAVEVPRERLAGGALRIHPPVIRNRRLWRWALNRRLDQLAARRH